MIRIAASVDPARAGIGARAEGWERTGSGGRTVREMGGLRLEILPHQSCRCEHSDQDTKQRLRQPSSDRLRSRAVFGPSAPQMRHRVYSFQVSMMDAKERSRNPPHHEVTTSSTRVQARSCEDGKASSSSIFTDARPIWRIYVQKRDSSIGTSPSHQG